MRVTVRAVERLMRNGYIRNTHETPWREYNAGFVWLALGYRHHRGEAQAECW